MSDPAATSPTQALRRSFHYRDLVAAGARFRPLNDSSVAADYGGADEAGLARMLGLADLSPLPRCGFKGPATADWLSGQGLAIGEESNRAYPLDDGILAARLAPGEVLILGDLAGSERRIAALEGAWSHASAGVWPVPRRDMSFWFMVVGSQAPAMFAKVCGVDLRPRSFADRRIAQTSVARTNCIVVRADCGETLAYHVLGDSASASFLWTSLVDAMGEFGGRPVGHEAILALSGAVAR